MTEMTITWITAAEAASAGRKEERVLIEQTPDFCLVFNTFLTREMERAGGDLFFRGPSGMVYRLARVTDDLSSVQGMAIHLRMAAESGGPRDQERVERDIWAFLEWLVDGVGGEWSVAALRKTGAIYKAPGAPERA
jgi:hypothetical protein